MNSVQDTKGKNTVSAGLKAILRKPKYATFLTLMTDIVIMDEGVKTGLWKLCTADQTQSAKLRADIKATTRGLEPKFTEVAKIVDEAKGSPAKLKANARFQELKSIIVEESELALQYQAQLATLVSHLQ